LVNDLTRGRPAGKAEAEDVDRSGPISVCARGLMGLALACSGCTGDTRLLVTIDNDSVVPASLRITQGTLHDPATQVSVGSRPFPLKVRFYDLHAAPSLVVLVEGLDSGGTVVSHGALKAALKTGRETDAELALTDGPSLDTDGDGIPDSVDECP